MHKSDTIAELTKALVKVQANLKPVAKNSDNPFYKSRYADLTSVWESCRKLLADNGLAVVQTSRPSDTTVVVDVDKQGNPRFGICIIVETTLLHTSGEYITSELLIPCVKNDPQGVGSAAQYGRRYGFSAMIGIVSDEDDDGNSHITQAPSPARQSVRPSSTTKASHRAELVAQLKAAAAEKNVNLAEHSGKHFPNIASTDLTDDQIKFLIEKL